ncbi:hypothetical protein O181_131091 [Austropuccinia psidii MF-1]|uniref:DUF659 domain-containing protein n=1 Tax=Austropuccinia psidii MF-1 TaxID=1389203 RepID=A0A9Q3L3D1_9BASI|nr:hypothetical protein [Austropuccinia psidii MF-1]
MSNHLWALHQLINQKTTNLDKTVTLDKYVQHQNPKKSLLAETLKTALIYCICDCDLPMSVSKSTSFQAFLELCNPLVLSILVRQKALTAHLPNVYFFHQEKLRALIYDSGKQLSFTTYNWTSPNIEAFMAITGHFMDKEFNLVSVLLGLTEIEGNHSGQSLANQFLTTLKQYDLEDSIIAITTDNASVNQQMAQELQDSTKSFAAKTQYIGCMACTLHLSAQDGLKALAKGPSTHEDKDIVDVGPMSISTLINPPDGLRLNYNSIISCISRLASYLCQSPQ